MSKAIETALLSANKIRPAGGYQMNDVIKEAIQAFLEAVDVEELAAVAMYGSIRFCNVSTDDVGYFDKEDFKAQAQAILSHLKIMCEG